jgi:hypothetical protein
MQRGAVQARTGQHQLHLDGGTREVESEPEVKVVTPEGISPEKAGPANLVDYVHPPIGKVAVDIPAGNSAEDIQHLIELFQFPVPEANGKAQARLKEIGAPAVPALVKALGSWDNKTWNQAMLVLQGIGDPAKPRPSPCSPTKTPPNLRVKSPS